MNNVVTKEDAEKKVEEYINTRREVIGLYIGKLEEAQHYFNDPTIEETNKIALYKLMLTIGNCIVLYDRIVLYILDNTENIININDGNTLKEVMNNLKEIIKNIETGKNLREILNNLKENTKLFEQKENNLDVIIDFESSNNENNKKENKLVVIIDLIIEKLNKVKEKLEEIQIN